MTGKGGLINIRKRATLFVILQPAKNLLFLNNFSKNQKGDPLNLNPQDVVMKTNSQKF